MLVVRTEQLTDGTHFRKQQTMNGKEYPQQYTNIAYAGAPPVKQAANGKRPSAKVGKLTNNHGNKN